MFSVIKNSCPIHGLLIYEKENSLSTQGLPLPPLEKCVSMVVFPRQDEENFVSMHGLPLSILEKQNPLQEFALHILGKLFSMHVVAPAVMTKTFSSLGEGNFLVCGGGTTH